MGKIDYKLLMRRNSEETYSKKLIETYIELNRQYHFQINMEDPILGNYRYIAVKMRNELRKCITYNEETDISISEDDRNLSIDRTICDMLVYYLYGVKKARAKESLWFCYGDLIYENLKTNLEFKEKKYAQCIDCGEWFEIDVKNTESERCSECYKKFRKKYKAQKEKERRARIRMDSAEPQKSQEFPRV